jgi:hypothetical protein
MTDARYIRQVEDRPPGGMHSARRIARVAEFLKAQSYLEVGVFRGTTFNCLNFKRKVAVDPRLGFDLEAFAERGVSFCQVTSDEYFISNGTKELFDIIFLDGLHTFTQTYRDFCNSLVCSHSQTVWLLDDVLPSDIYSAWPNAAEARAARKQETGNPSPAWNGDVYKILLAVHDFYPALSYVIITDRGNPQALVWKVPRIDYKPILNSLEAIDRLSYFDFLALKPRLRMAKEEEALEIMFASLRTRHEPEELVEEPEAVAV